MKNLICPISPLRINENTARVTGFMMAAMIALFAFTRNITFILVIVVDYFLRAFTSLKYSPASWLASQTLGLFYVNRKISLVVGLVLMGFALLESVFNVCVGCLVYTYIILPFFKREE